MANQPLPAQVPAKPTAPNSLKNPPSAAVTMILVRRRLKIYFLTESELDSLVEGNSSVDLTFFGICFGSLVSLIGTLVSLGASNGPAHTMISGLVIVFLLGSIFFGITGWRNNSRSRKQLLKLKRRYDEEAQIEK